jgi:hypothetical protein
MVTLKKFATVVLAVLAGTLVPVEAATRCCSHKVGSTTYLVCEGESGKTECRSFRVGSTTYTRCR